MTTFCLGWGQAESIPRTIAENNRRQNISSKMCEIQETLENSDRMKNSAKPERSRKKSWDYGLTLEDLERFEKMPPFLLLSSIKSFDSLFFLFVTMLYDPEKLSGRLEVAPIVKNNFEGVEMVILSTIKIKLKNIFIIKLCSWASTSAHGDFLSVTAFIYGGGGRPGGLLYKSIQGLRICQ